MTTSLDRSLLNYHLHVTLTPASRAPLASAKPIKPPGTHLDKVQPALARTLRRADDSDFLIPKEERLPRGSSWTAAGLTSAVLLAAEPLRNMLSGMAAAGDPVAIAELDNISKLCLQKGGYPGWHVKEQGYVQEAEGPFDDAVDAIVRHLPDPTDYTLKGARRGTNHGSPSFRSDDEDMIAHAALAAALHDWSDYEELHASIAGGLDGVTFPVGTLLSRTGPVAKMASVYDWVGEERALVGEAVGDAPRRREVIGVPMTCFFRLRPMYRFLMGVISQLPCFAGGRSLASIEDALCPRLEGRRPVNDDISRYDQSVSRHLQVSMGRALVARWPALRPHVDFWLEVERIPVAAPALRRSSEGFAYKSSGMTTSGIILTAVMGTLFNAARCAYCAMRAGMFNDLDSAAEWALKSGDLVLLGDDTVIVPDRPLNEEKWAAASLEMNFESKILPGAVFLRKVFTTRGSYGLASRFIQQTAFNEHPPRTEALEILGIATRILNARDGPHFDAAYRAIAMPFTPLEGTTPDQIVARLDDPDFQAQVVADAQEGNNPFLLSREEVEGMTASPGAEKLAFLTRLMGRPLFERWDNVGLQNLSRDELLKLARTIFNRDRPRPAGVEETTWKEQTKSLNTKALLEAGLR